MKINKRTLLFIIEDYILSVLSWFLFYSARKIFIEKTEFNTDIQFIKGILLVPIFWILIYTLQGTYVDIKRLYRSRIINLTIFSSFIGSFLLFFFVLIDDQINTYDTYYKSLGILFILQFLLIIISRFVFVTIQVHRIHNGKDCFNTLLIGNSNKITEFEKELNSAKKSIGNKIINVFYTNDSENEIFKKEIIENIVSQIKEKKIEEVIIVEDNNPTKDFQNLLARLSGLGVSVKMKASDYDIAIGSLKQNNLFGLLIKEIQFDPMPLWQKSIKRTLDILISILSLIILAPLFIIISIGIKKSSKGSIFFLQERIGKHGNPFLIIKFRTMYFNSEKNGPQLSSTHDQRITPFGKFLRKTRIDEFPQFVNVIKGEMSLVGPRPERQFYIDQIAEKEPSFLQLSLVKPGITSWGQVKYGYAENVEQMIQRMRFDLLYLKNRSLALDFKIMFYTLITIIKAKGK